MGASWQQALGLGQWVWGKWRGFSQLEEQQSELSRSPGAVGLGTQLLSIWSPSSELSPNPTPKATFLESLLKTKQTNKQIGLQGLSPSNFTHTMFSVSCLFSSKDIFITAALS